MNIQNTNILNSSPGFPNGYLSKDNSWAAVPFGNQFIVIHKGQQVHTCKTYNDAKEYIDKKSKALKKKSLGTLKDLL